MGEIKNSLLIIGSAKHSQSTSESLGNYLQQRLSTNGVQASSVKLYQHILSQSDKESLLKSLNDSDLWILSMPLYIDSTPYLVVKWMEWMVEIHSSIQRLSEKQMMAIVNCGFPESKHNELAVSISQQFAKTIGVKWLGGLSLGGGEVIHGDPLETKGGMIRHAKQALDLSAEAILSGEKIPEYAKDIMAKSFVPTWIYTLVGEVGWRQQARQYNQQKHLKDRPYEE